MSRRRRLVAGAAATVALAALGACGSPSPNPEPAAAPTSTAPAEASPTASPAASPTSPGTEPGDGATPSEAPVADAGADVAPGETEPVLPVTLIDDTGAEVVIESVERIVPVDGDLTEVVFALGLGDNVVATDLSATYPPQVDSLPDIGYQRALNPEPIAAVEPTVVLATDLAEPSETLERLRDLSIPVVVVDRHATLDGPADKIRAVADALGVPDRGEALARTVEADIAAAVATARLATAAVDDPPRVAALYLRGQQVQLVLGEGSGIDAVLDAVGVVDIADELGVVDNRPISAEALLAAAPDVLVVTTTGLESVGGIEGLLTIAGIAETPAGQNRRILAYEDQYLLGGGPRTGRLMDELVADLYPTEAPPSEPGDLTP